MIGSDLIRLYGQTLIHLPTDREIPENVEQGNF